MQIVNRYMKGFLLAGLIATTPALSQAQDQESLSCEKCRVNQALKCTTQSKSVKHLNAKTAPAACHKQVMDAKCKSVCPNQ